MLNKDKMPELINLQEENKTCCSWDRELPDVDKDCWSWVIDKEQPFSIFTMGESIKPTLTNEGYIVWHKVNENK